MECLFFLNNPPASSSTYLSCAPSYTQFSVKPEVAPHPTSAVMRCDISYAPPLPWLAIASAHRKVGPADTYIKVGDNMCV